MKSNVRPPCTVYSVGKIVDCERVIERKPNPNTCSAHSGWRKSNKTDL